MKSVDLHRLKEGLDQNLQNRALAAYCNISVSQLPSLIKHHFPNLYQHRLQTDCHEILKLMMCGLSLREIAHRLGYDTAKHVKVFISLHRPQEIKAYLRRQKTQKHVWSLKKHVKSLLDEGQSLSEIARRCNIHITTLRRRLKTHLPDYKTRRSLSPLSDILPQDDHIAATLYAELKNDRLIGLVAQSLSLPEESVRQVLQTRLLRL